MKSLIVLCLMIAPLASQAFFEARATFGVTNKKTETSDLCSNCTTIGAPSIAPAFIGADAIIKIPLFPLGLGVRYEGMNVSGTSGNYEANIKYTRTAFLVNYRIIDTILHFGPIASYGISHSGSVSIKESGTQRVNFSADGASSYSVGLELGVKPLIVIPLAIGAEAGYMGYKWNEVSNTVDGTKKSLDLSGTYIKVFIGLDI